MMSPDSAPGPGPDPAPASRPRHDMRSLYARVLLVQVAALIALWILQRAFAGG